MPGIVIEPIKAVYWPIPKCACTSLKARIAEFLGYDDSDPQFPHEAPFQWTEDPIEGFEDFAIVRHPLDRLHSLWVNKIAPGHPIGWDYENEMDMNVFGRHLHYFRSRMTFGDFCAAIVSIPVEDADPHWAPQSGQFPESCAIIKMEDAGVLMRLLLPHMNVTEEPRDWKSDFARINPAAEDRVWDYYEEDLSYLEYD